MNSGQSSLCHCWPLQKPFGEPVSRWEPRNKDLVLGEILAALQAKQTLHIPHDRSRSSQSFQSSHLAQQGGPAVTVTGAWLLTAAGPQVPWAALPTEPTSPVSS